MIRNEILCWMGASDAQLHIQNKVEQRGNESGKALAGYRPSPCTPPSSEQSDGKDVYDGGV